MSVCYTTSEEIENENFSKEQNIINIDDIPLEKREFIEQIIKYIPEY